jgi:outer membrane protein assembly factor BamB
MKDRVGTCALAIVLFAAVVHGQREGRWTGRYEGPVENFAEPGSLRALREDLAAGRFAEAARAVEAQIQNSADRLTASEDGMGLVSVGHWVDLLIDSLAAGQRRGLEQEYRRQFDEAAQAALEGARKEEGALYETLYAVGRRYRLSSIAGAALAEAAKRAVRIGDAPAALAMYELARGSGWNAEPSDRQFIEACRELMAEEDRGATARGGWRGPIAFDAAWYGRGEASGMSRHLFYAADGITYAIGPRQALALKENGQTAWRWTATEGLAGMALADRARGRGRPPTFGPAVFVSATGPQIIVARQPRGTGRDFVLRAWRGSDGKLLWSSEQHVAMESIALASTPLVCGRYVYCSAVEYGEDSATLVLAAIDLLNGKLIFKSPLGTMLGMKRSRADIPGWDEFWEQTEVAVAGDTVYLTPSAGAAMAVGRFDGRVRWIAPYRATVVGAERIGRRGEGEERARTRRDAPREQAELLRYRGTPVVCGGVLVVAPQDTGAVLGLERSTGRQLWRLDTPPGGTHTLVAGTAEVAIFAGSGIRAVDARSGEERWEWEPAGAKVSGPPAMAGGALYVPSSDLKITALDPGTGRVAEGKGKPPNFRQVVASEAGKKALEEATVLRTVGLPGTVGRN